MGALQIVRGGNLAFFQPKVQFSKLRGGARVGLSGLKGGAPPLNYTYVHTLFFVFCCDDAKMPCHYSKMGKNARPGHYS